MYIDRLLRLIAGTFVLLSLALAHFHNPNLTVHGDRRYFDRRVRNGQSTG